MGGANGVTKDPPPRSHLVTPCDSLVRRNQLMSSSVNFAVSVAHSRDSARALTLFFFLLPRLVRVLTSNKGSDR